MKERLVELINSGKSINEILEIVGENDIEVLYRLSYALEYENVVNAVKEYYKKYSFDGKVILAADAHLGSRYADMKILDKIYNKADNDGVPVIMVGDFIQGKTEKYMVLYDYYKQIDHVMDALSKKPNVDTYYLFGNHETNLHYLDQLDFINRLDDAANAHYIGSENGYIYLGSDEPIKINHYIPHKKASYRERPDIQTEYTFEGHHHDSLRRDNDHTIHIPPASIVANSINGSGFIELIDEGDKYLSRRIGFDTSYNFTTREEVTLQKIKRN